MAYSNAGGSYLESSLAENFIDEPCESKDCGRKTKLRVEKCCHIVCEVCLSAVRGFNKSGKEVYFCPVCFITSRAQSTWILPGTLHKMCVCKKLCTLCFLQEAIHRHECGHILCIRCLRQLADKTGQLHCEVWSCQKEVSRRAIDDRLKTVNSILIWRHFKVPKRYANICTSPGCIDMPIFTLKSCDHSVCYKCAVGGLERKSFDEEYLKCPSKTCETTLPATTLENYLFTLKGLSFMTAVFLEITSCKCCRCGEDNLCNDKDIHVHLRNRYCVHDHAFCVKCLQEIQKERRSECEGNILGADITEVQITCLYNQCPVKTPMRCINNMIDGLLGKNPQFLVDVFLRPSDIGEKCDTCHKCDAFVTKLVCSHAVCLTCIGNIIRDNECYEQCTPVTGLCSNNIPITVYKTVLHGSFSNGHQKNKDCNKPDYKGRLPLCIQKEDCIRDTVTVTLTAKSDYPWPNAVARWQKNHADLPFDDYKYRIINDVQTFKLTIYNFQTPDEGRYRLIMEIPMGENESEEIDVKVPYDIPKLRVQNMKTDNRTLCLKATIESQIPIIISWWEKDDKKISISSSSSKYKETETKDSRELIILQPSLSDHGSYKFIAQNAVGQGDSKSIELKVEKEFPVLTVKMTLLKKNTKLQLIGHCNHKMWNGVWKKSGKRVDTGNATKFYTPFPNAEGNVTLVIYNVTKADEGKYSFEATTKEGVIKSEPVNFIIPRENKGPNANVRDPQTNDDRAAKKSGNTPPIHSPSQGFHNLSLEQGAECSIGLVEPPYDEENRCQICEKPAVAEFDLCKHRYCIEHLRYLCKISASRHVKCTEAKCSSFVTKTGIEKFCCGISFQLKMPMYFEVRTKGICGKCSRKAVFKILSCNHGFCKRCLFDCKGKMECTVCCNGRIPTEDYFDYLRSSLETEEETPFIIKRNDVDSDGYQTLFFLKCSTTNCTNEADFAIIRCRHLFCNTCGMQMESLDNSLEIKLGKCLVDGCTELFPFPSFLRSKKRDTKEETSMSTLTSVAGIDNAHASAPSTSGEYRQMEATSEHHHSSSEKRKKGTDDKAVEKRLKPIPSRGLLNIGFSCYRNSILQILAETPKFLEQIQDAIPHKTDHWITAFCEVIYGIQNQSTAEKEDCLHSFHFGFNQINAGFQEYRQEDTLSFFTSLLNGIEDEYNNTTKFKGEGEKLLNPVNIFKGQLKDRYCCKECSHIEDFNHSSFFSLPLPRIDSSRKTMTIGSCLMGLLKKEEVDLPCSKCGSLGVTKEMDIVEYPEILVLQICKLEEVEYYGMERKLEKQSFQKFRFWDDFKGLTNKELIKKIGLKTLLPYRLFGVVVHWGSESGGHYISFVKRKSDRKWIRCDDSYITDSSIDAVRKSDAYLLFYEKISSETKV
ncbi:uncharacterized protein LOC125674716 isoform X2 [Ostrea edulis]|uniref:uncharacterized protein LOC125674716 isoform X2 n=1 Tax=Ostrea edulis TaxID=37623 RepID=UPI0024B00083|nr:uncharacterized protein LOC125674716 isoform X2 [Ostrea edulis]